MLVEREIHESQLRPAGVMEFLSSLRETPEERERDRDGDATLRYVSRHETKLGTVSLFGKQEDDDDDDDERGLLVIRMRDDDFFLQFFFFGRLKGFGERLPCLRSFDTHRNVRLVFFLNFRREY